MYFRNRVITKLAEDAGAQDVLDGRGLPQRLAAQGAGDISARPALLRRPACSSRRDHRIQAELTKLARIPLLVVDLCEPQVVEERLREVVKDSATSGPANITVAGQFWV